MTIQKLNRRRVRFPLGAVLRRLMLPLFGLICCVGTAPAVLAQPPEGFRGGGFRGGERGSDRGGEDRGRSERGSSERGGERGSFGGGERGGFGGGERGGFGGGERGGFGGFGGGFGGPGGGFGGGSSDFLERLDRNGNGMLDPDEMEGPAGFIISRAQREDPGLRTDRPIPMSRLKEIMDRARSGGRDSGGRDAGGQRGPERDEFDPAIAEAMKPAALVPGFGDNQATPPPIKGFGSMAELLAVEVTAADTREAEELLRRSDRNRDNFLSGDEISNRWPGNPLDFDRDGDGRLSVSELAVRAARLRVTTAAVNSNRDRNRSRDRGGEQREQSEPVDPYNGRRSFAMSSRQLPAGIPAWFTAKDLDGDQQVSMAEYAQVWTAERVDEFLAFDLNQDGYITAIECLAGIRNGARSPSTGGGPSGSVSSGSSSSAGRDYGSGDSSNREYGMRSSGGSGFGSRDQSGAAPAARDAGEPSAATAEKSTGETDLPATVSEKSMAHAVRMVERNDKNKDGALTPDEWKDMLIDPSPADFDHDGRITVQEFAQWTEAKQSSR